MTLFVSAGIPQVAFDNGKDVLLANGSNGAPLDPSPRAPQIEDDPTFSPDGELGRVQERRPDLPARPRQEGRRAGGAHPKGERFSDLAWAPTGDQNVLALIKREGDDPATAKTSLCFGQDRPGRHGDPLPAAGAQPAGPQDQLVGERQDAARLGRDPRLQPVRDGPLHEQGAVLHRSRTSGRARASRRTRASPDRARSMPSRRPTARSSPWSASGASGRAGAVRDHAAGLPPAGRQAARRRWPARRSGARTARSCLSCAPTTASTRSTGNLVRVPRKTPKDQRSLRLDGDNPAFQPLTVE